MKLIGGKLCNDRFKRILRNSEAGTTGVHFIEQQAATTGQELKIGGVRNKAVMVTVFVQSFDLFMRKLSISFFNFKKNLSNFA